MWSISLEVVFGTFWTTLYLNQFYLMQILVYLNGSFELSIIICWKMLFWYSFKIRVCCLCR